MSNIGGKKRESTSNQDYAKKVGLFEAKVIAVNPTAEEYKDVLNIELPETSKATEYLSTTEEGIVKLRLDFWVEEVKAKNKFKLTFFLENKVKENQDKTKKQYINNIGTTSWAADPNDLADWFTNRDYRVAFVGEEDLYNFLRTWLGNLDYRDAETTLQLDWKALMKGNVRDIKSQINGEYATNVGVLATIKTVVKDGETKEYQGVYTKAFLSPYNLKQFRVVDYTDPSTVSKLREKKTKELKPHERFVLNVTGEYGCKDFYVLKDVRDYDPSANLAASDAVISSDDATY